MNESYVLTAFMQTPWAIMPSKLMVLEEIVTRHLSGEKLSAEEIQARLQGAAVRPQNRNVRSIAVLPLFGTIIPRADFFEESSGATSAENFGRLFAQLVDDPSIDAIVIDVNSPGGNVYGVEELSQQIFDARGSKPIVAVANHLMASAAYWIGTAADELVVSPSAEVGSIGVFSVHQDMSEALQKVGVKVSLISQGKYKVEGNPYEPLNDEARASIQKNVDEYYDAFAEAVARNRGVKVSTVRNGFGEGRVVGAEEALKLGMADRIETLDQTVSRLLSSGAKGTGVRGQGGTDVNASAGQEPGADNPVDRGNPADRGNELVHLQEARARLEKVGNIDFQGDPNMTTLLRDLLKARAEKVERAQTIVDGADSECRDLNDSERAEFAQLLGEGESRGDIGALDAQIEKVQGERERLRKAASRKFVGEDAEGKQGAEKPDGQGVTKMTRAEFNALSPDERLAFSKTGGKLTD